MATHVMATLSREDALAVLDDHQSRTHHTGQMESPDARSLGYNPICGDRYEVFIKVQESQIEAVRFHGFGCVISKASASMMAQTIEGMELQSAKTAIEEFRAAMLNGSRFPEGIEPDVYALVGVREHPSRLMCVLLPWQTAAAALRGESQTTTE